MEQVYTQKISEGPIIHHEMKEQDSFYCFHGSCQPSRVKAEESCRESGGEFLFPQASHQSILIDQ